MFDSTDGMLAEEALFCGAHFAHIAERNRHERVKRISKIAERYVRAQRRCSLR